MPRFGNSREKIIIISRMGRLKIFSEVVAI